MSRSARVSIGILVLSLSALAGCGDDTPTAPTPPSPPPVTTTPPPPPPPPPPEPAALSSLTLNPPTVRSQARPQGTVTLTAAAPTGGAVVTLQTNGVDGARVPPSVTVAAGSTSQTFTIDTATVPAPTQVTITASYLGIARQAVLTVEPPALEPFFKVNSSSEGTDSCAIADASGSVDCQFDASTSLGFAAVYRWTFTVANNPTLTVNTSSPVLTPPTTCADLSGGTVAGNGTVSLVATLRLEDRQGNLSPPLQRFIALFPKGRCGY